MIENVLQKSTSLKISRYTQLLSVSDTIVIGSSWYYIVDTILV